MEHDPRLTIFWIVHLAMLGLFCVEIAFVLSVWLKAKVPGLPATASRGRKLGSVLGQTFRLVASRRLWTLLRILVVDGMVHRRLYRANRRRWAAHILVFGSWLLLGIMSTITGVVVEILPLFGMSPEAIASVPLLGHLFHADVWWVALLNEVLGLMVMAGMILVIYRRYIQKDPQLRTIPADSIVIALLTLIAFSGFPTETFRLLADYSTPLGAFVPSPTMLPADRFPAALHSVWGPQSGFAGFSAAWLLGMLGASPSIWEILHSISFWSHFAFATALLYYLPFSRFFHVIMSPVIVAYNTMVTREAGGESQRARRQISEPVL
jgi:hypothetical protein